MSGHTAEVHVAHPSVVPSGIKPIIGNTGATPESTIECLRRENPSVKKGSRDYNGEREDNCGLCWATSEPPEEELLPDRGAQPRCHAPRAPLNKGGVVVRCSEGHSMSIKMNRELHVPDMVRGVTFPVHGECTECAMDIHIEDAFYNCKTCDELLCLKCSRRQLGMPMSRTAVDPNSIINLEPGDILLVGPTDWGIHHVQLVTSPLVMDPTLLQILKDDPESDGVGLVDGDELWYCNTIESTQSRSGDTFWWYATRTYFKRNQYNETASIVADWRPGASAVQVLQKALPFKILLHPLRKKFGGLGLDHALFGNIVAEAAEESQQYGQQTAVKAWIHARLARAQKKFGLPTRVTLDQYPTAGARRQLLRCYEETWEEPPICASVAVKVWQKYFKALHEHYDEDAVVDIISYMPCFCHKILPAQMARELALCGWYLVDNLEEAIRNT